MGLSNGMLIICKDHPEWGVWKVKDCYDFEHGLYEIQGGSGCKILSMGEFYKFWKLI